MNPTAIFDSLVLSLNLINRLTEFVSNLRTQIDNEIPNAELRLEALDETVARLKAEGKIPADYQMPVLS